MVIACDRCELETGIDHEINQGRLHLGLTRLEVVSTNKRAMFLGKFDSTFDKGILRRAIDEWSFLKNTGYSKDCGWGNLVVAVFNRIQKIVSGIIDAKQSFCISFGIGCPKNDDFVKIMVTLEFTVAELALF